MADPDKPAGIDRKIALDARDWIVRLNSGNVSDADLQRFKAWRDLSPEHKQAFERERIFWRQLQVLDGESNGAPPFRRSPPAQRRGVPGRRGFLLGSGAVAMTAAAMIAAPRVGVWLNADFATAVGEMASFALPDGSTVTLNTDSAIAVDFTPVLRLVSLLKGEAEFKVSPNPASVFRVAALGGNSDALGTTFTVKAIDDLATVTVTDGQVQVAGPASPTDLEEAGAVRVELSAAQQTMYRAGEAPAPANDADTEIANAWRGGKVIFDGKPFGGAVAELGRYVSEPIVMAPGVNVNLPVSAIFSTREALAAVQALARTQGRAARRIPGVMVLIS
jgi:transmembrane sensor